MKFLLFAPFLLITSVFAAPSVTKNTSSAILQSGDTTLQMHFGKNDVRVTIRTLKVQNTAATGFPLGQQIHNTTVTIVHDLIILINEQPLLVPYSVFSDLTDPREARLELKKNFNILSIYGGDGADSYKLQVYFDSTKVYRRKLYDLLVPNELLEETFYQLRILRDTP